MTPRIKTLKKTLTFSLLAGLALLGTHSLSSCAATQGPGGVNTSEGGFSLLGLDGDESTVKGKGKHHRGFHRRGMKFLMKDLNLSADQKSQLKALMKDTHASRKSARPQMKAIKVKMKAAFLSDSFDTSSIKTEIQNTISANKEAQVKTMTQTLIKGYAILTPEQQGKLKLKLDEVSKKMKGFAKSPMAGKFKNHHQKKLEKLTKELGLSASQKSQLSTLFEARKSGWADKITQMDSLKNSLFQELSKASPDAEKLKSLIEPIANKMGEKLDKKLNHLTQLHSILTPSQREKMVALMEKHHGHRRRRHHK